jgi:phage tail-like protein
MARTQVLDELLTHEFHIIDIDIQPPFNPPILLWPTAGFSSVSAPELTIETDTITEGTSDYTYPILKRASTSPLILSKGVSMYNSDFWRWIIGGLSGHNDQELSLSLTGMPLAPARRRNLLLIHSSGLSVKGLIKVMQNGSIREKIFGSLLMPAAGITAVASAAVSLLSEGELDLNMLGIPGRAYMLFDCLPVRYKTGTDFDATETAVSIEELELAYTRFEVFGAFG